MFIIILKQTQSTDHLLYSHVSVSSFMPFPSECASTSSGLPLMDSQRVVTVLNQGVDEQLAQYLADVLAETTEDMRDMYVII